MVILRTVILMILTNIMFWFGSNTQFLVKNQRLAVIVCVVFGILAALISFYTNKCSYGNFTMWELRMMAFSSSYVTFPLFTWIFFNEPITHPKTLISIAISCVLVCVQIFWK